MVASAPQSRFAELVAIDLPTAPTRASQATSPGRPVSTWTAELPNCDETYVPPRQFLDSRGAERARACILIRFGEYPQASHSQLQKELGFDHRSAVGWHIKRLVDEGLLEKAPGRRHVLTKAGGACVAYLEAHAGGESAWRRLVIGAFGSYNQAGARAIREAARLLDLDYATRRKGAVRRQRDGPDMEVVRKVTYRAIIRALRSCPSTLGAGKMVGLVSGAFRDRLATLVSHARRVREQT